MSLKIIHFNARKNRLLNHRLLEWKHEGIDIVCVNEPPLHENLQTSSTRIYGPNDNTACIVVLNDNLHPTPLAQLSGHALIKLNQLLIHSIYLKPTSNSGDHNEITKLIHVLQHPTPNTIILGDLNAKTIRLQPITSDTARATRILKPIDTNGWLILNKYNIPTHHCHRNGQLFSSSVLDWIISSPDQSSMIAIETLPAVTHSDHLPILVTVHSAPSPTPLKSGYIIDIPLFLLHVSDLDPHDHPDHLMDMIMDAVDKSLKPINTITSLIDSSTLKAISKPLLQEKRRLKRAKGTAADAIKQRIVKERQIRAANIKQLLTTNFRKNISSSNSLSFIQSKIRKETSTKTSISYIMDGPSKIDDPVLISNKVISSLFPSHQLHPDDTHWNPTSTYDLNPIQQHEIRWALKKQSNSAPGLDRINKQTLTAWYSKNKTFFTTLFTRWLNNHPIPQLLRTTELTLILKKQGEPDVKNLRPIGRPSMIIRIFERIILNRMSFHFSTNNFNFLPQYAHSKKLTLQHALFNLTKHEPSSNPLLYIACDIKGAYNTVHHGPILKQLSRLNVPNNLIKCASSLLKDRALRIHGVDHPMPIGVPQGGVISPLFFNLAIQQCLESTLSLFETGVSIVAYCDDITLILKLESRSYTHSQSKINQILNHLNHSLEQVNLSLSRDKTVALSTPVILNHLPDIHIDQTQITRTNSHKILGLTLDKPHLTSFSSHKKLIFHKSRRAITNISRFLRLPYLRLAKKATLADSYVHSCLLPTALVWVNNKLTSHDINSLLAIDRLLSIHIFKLPPTTPNAVAVAILPTPPSLVKITLEKQKQLLRINETQLNNRPHFKNTPILPLIHPSHNLAINLTNNITNQSDLLLWLQSNTHNQWIFFTDASKSSRDSPSGIAFALLNHSLQIIHTELHRVHPSHSVFTAEATAIWSSIEYIKRNNLYGNITIFSDSLSTISALSSSHPTDSLIIQRIKTSIHQILSASSTHIQLGWCKAHNGIIPNEFADLLAKQASSSPLPILSLPISPTEFRYETQQFALTLRNTLYLNTPGGSIFKQFFPDLLEVQKRKKYFNSSTLRLYMGHGPFIFDAIKYSATKHLSPLCQCNLNLNQTIQHLLTECPIILTHCSDQFKQSGLETLLVNHSHLPWEQLNKLDPIHLFIFSSAPEILSLSLSMLKKVDTLNQHQFRC